MDWIRSLQDQYRFPILAGILALRTRPAGHSAEWVTFHWLFRRISSYSMKSLSNSYRICLPFLFRFVKHSLQSEKVLQNVFRHIFHPDTHEVIHVPTPTNMKKYPFIGYFFIFVGVQGFEPWVFGTQNQNVSRYTTLRVIWIITQSTR